MAKRKTRTEQVRLNGDRLLDAARRVFLAKGYAAASLDAIADAAGFSKGVVYSQFEGKGDLFLTLLERRIEERAAQNEKIIAESSEREGLTTLLDVAQRLFQEEPEWSMLVIEFRVHAARDRRLRERYAKAHGRTVERLAAAIEKLHERDGLEPAFPMRTMAELILAVGAGIELERLNDPNALPAETVLQMIPRAIGLEARATKERR